MVVWLVETCILEIEVYDKNDANRLELGIRRVRKRSGKSAIYFLFEKYVVLGLLTLH